MINKKYVSIFGRYSNRVIQGLFTLIRPMFLFVSMSKMYRFFLLLIMYILLAYVWVEK